MIVRKVRGQNKIDKIIISRAEAEVVERLGVNLELYVKTQLIRIAKKRRWHWYFEKEKNK